MATRLLLISVVACLSRVDDEPAPLRPPPAGEFLVIPLRLHVLTADDLPDVDCKLSDDDLRRILGKVNAIWHQAGIHWGLESIVHEPAARQGRFKAAREADANRAVPLGLFRVLMPEKSRSDEGLHVYYIHKFSVNGVYLGDRIAFVQETAQLRKVEGGIDEPIPRVTAHELGHALGLPHRQARTNLLASGTTGTILNEEEKAIAREQAKKTPGTRTVEELSALASTEKDEERAAMFRRWLEEIPGR